MAIKREYLVVIVLLLILIGGYTSQCYYKTEHEAKKKADHKVNLTLHSNQVQEIGFIYNVTVTRDLIEHVKNIYWGVRIPSTNKTYSCTWEGGFSEYKENEGVILIHVPDGGASNIEWDGYIIGINGSHEGKRTRVWAVDHNY